MDRQFDYEVAFSFHGADEGLATQLNDLLSDRLKTFIYSERQKELAGTDGQESFSDVYGRTARVVVILYRQDYGQTRWTRVELDAIKNRSLEDGWDFTFFIPTEDIPSMPPWVPKTRLYAGLKRWGLEGAAAAIEARVTEAGGRPHEETVAERAARYKRAADLKALQKQFLSSDRGVQSASAAYASFGEALELTCAELAETGLRIHFQVSDAFFIVGGLTPVNAICSFRPRYSNTLEDTFLHVTYYKGFPRLPGFMPSMSGAQELKKRRYAWELVAVGREAYLALDEKGREFDPSGLAHHVLRQYMDLADRTVADYR